MKIYVNLGYEVKTKFFFSHKPLNYTQYEIYETFIEFTIQVTKTLEENLQSLIRK